MKILTVLFVILVLAVSASAATELRDVNIIGNLGFYAYEQGEFALAEKLFLKALQEDSGYDHARFNLATLYNEQGRYGEAIEQLEQLTANNPKNVQYQYDLGVNYIANFRFGTQQIADFYAGIAAYETAAQIDANYAHVQNNLHILYNIKSEFDL